MIGRVSGKTGYGALRGDQHSWPAIVVVVNSDRCDKAIKTNIAAPLQAPRSPTKTNPKYQLVIRSLADLDATRYATRYLGSRPLARSVHVERSTTLQSISKIIELDKAFVDPMPTIVAPPNSAPKQFARYGATGN